MPPYVYRDGHPKESHSAQMIREHQERNHDVIKATLKVAHEITRERQRQIFEERHNKDDVLVNGELAGAAMCYLTTSFPEGLFPIFITKVLAVIWPWSQQWWKPTTPRRDLIKAAALIVAEIERLDRLPK